MSKDFAKDYIDVAARIVEFRGKYPNGSLQPANADEPVKIVTVGDKTFLQYVACAYRSADDERPGIGVAWETFPGRTPYTRDSEAMVVETSAWGRAIVAALAADTKKGVASADEVRAARTSEPAEPDPLVEAKQRVWETKPADWDKDQLAADYQQRYEKPIAAATAEDLHSYAAEMLAERELGGEQVAA